MATEILVVDDEAAIAGLVEVYLTNEGFSVHKALTAAEALDILAAHPIDLAILDVMLPDLDGFTLCQKIRETHLFPIIMLTARVEDMDKITGLTLGADDYITKPFNPLELVARVKAHLSRYARLTGTAVKKPPETQVLTVGDVQIFPQSWKVFKAGREIKMPNREFSLLQFLAEHPNMVFSKEKLFETIWGFDYVGDSATVTVHIGRIREKLASLGLTDFIKTKHRQGYTI